MLKEHVTYLEDGVRFSDSLLWSEQQKYFAKKGVEAWAHGEVPYYISSNKLIAHHYAQIIFRYLKESVNNGFINVKEPIYTLELGTGSGKFSYLFLNELLPLLEQFKLDHLKFCYVMTDFTESNLKFWRSHPAFSQFLATKKLDFAIYAIDQELTGQPVMQLVNQNVVLNSGSCKNPILAIGNYIFDTVKHDAFRVSTGKLEESLVSIKTPNTNIDANNKITSLDKLEAEFSFREINFPYYPNTYLDEILSYYREHLKDGNFLVPIGGITCIDVLRKLSNDRLFMLLGDKAYTSLSAMRGLNEPHIAFHGSFSMMVNFDCVGRYLQKIGGDMLLADDYVGFKVCAFSLGQKFSALPDTKWAYEEFSQHLSTREFLPLKNKVLADVVNLDLEQIISLLKFSYWDADIFMSVVERLAYVIKQCNQITKDSLRMDLEKVYKNYYFIKNNKNVLFELGRIYHLLDDFSESAKYYEKSLTAFGANSSTHFNLGLCYFYSQKIDAATEHFQNALKFDSNNQAAREWLIYLRDQGKLNV